MFTYSWVTQGRRRATGFTTAARSRRWGSRRRLARAVAIGMVLAVLALGQSVRKSRCGGLGFGLPSVQVLQNAIRAWCKE
jgi:hypothetical protein